MIKPEWSEIIEQAIEDRLLDVHTCLPCIVETVNLSDRTVDVILGLKRPIENEDGILSLEDLPKLSNVPISIWQAGTKFISMPIAPGDGGRVQFSEADWGQWRELGVETSPCDVGRHTLSSGVFIPDVTTIAKRFTEAAGAQLANDIVVGAVGGVQARFKNTTIQIVSGGATDATDFVAMAAKVEGFINDFLTMFNSWSPVAQDGGAALKTLFTSTFTGFTNNMKSINLKADG